MSRLSNMRKLLAEALKEPYDNKLYIEDLHLSIAFFEKAEANERLAKEVITTPIEVKAVKVETGFIPVY